VELGGSIYRFVIPWFSIPNQCIAPYTIKVDVFGVKALKTLEKHFPAVKKPTTELYNDVSGIILLPYHKGLEGKDHILWVYSTEFLKNGQQGLVARGKAAVITFIAVGNETLYQVGSYLMAKRVRGAYVDNNANRRPEYIVRQ
jgi:hypothetical protein